MKRPLGMICILFVTICILCLQVIHVPLPDYGKWDGKKVILTGRISKKETRTVSGENTIVITIDEIKTGEQDMEPPNGKVICYLQGQEAEPEMGSRVKIRGKLSCFEQAANPGQFSQADYYQILQTDFRMYRCDILAKSKSYHRYQEGLYRLREVFGRTIDQCFAQEEAAVMRAMLLGESGGTDTELKELYKRNGIVHIMAISGLHISIIGMGLYRLLRRIAVPIPIAAGIPILVMYSYGVMTNMSTSSYRAIVMFSLHMAAHMIGRTYDLLTALSVAAIMLLIEQPLYLKHSGFLFSFLAVMAIGLFVPSMIYDISLKIPICNKSLLAFLSGACISAFTLPVNLIFYYQFPLYSVFLNLLVIPLMSIVMTAGLLAMTTGIFLPLPGKLAAAICSLVLKFYEICCRGCDYLPGNNLIIGKPQIWQVIIYSGILILLILFHKRLKPLIRFCILACGICLLVLRSPGGMAVTFLDVGQGDCIHIQDPTGKNYLIDGGSSDVQNVGEYRIEPYLKSKGIKRLEAIFITHPDEDHYNGIRYLISNMKIHGIHIANLILPDISPASKESEYAELERLAAEAGIGLRYIGAGQRIEAGEMVLECLHPVKGFASTDNNSYSMVLWLEYRDFKALFTGDVEDIGEQMLVQYIGKKQSMRHLTLLKVAHHGSRNSTPSALLELLQPSYAVISAGKKNSYGHPHEEVLERLEKVGSGVYITYEKGAVMIETDGRRMGIEGFRR